MAPRNRGALPRMIIEDGSEELNRMSETQEWKRKEEQTEKLFKVTLVSKLKRVVMLYTLTLNQDHIARFKKEERHLLQNISDFHEKRFEKKEFPEIPAPELMTPLKPSRVKVDHLAMLRKETEKVKDWPNIDITGESHLDLPEIIDEQRSFGSEIPSLLNTSFVGETLNLYDNINGVSETESPEEENIDITESPGMT